LLRNRAPATPREPGRRHRASHSTRGSAASTRAASRDACSRIRGSSPPSSPRATVWRWPSSA